MRRWKPESAKPFVGANRGSSGQFRWPWSGMAGALLDLVLPPACAVCGNDLEDQKAGCREPQDLGSSGNFAPRKCRLDQTLCVTCRRALVGGSWVWCHRCGALLAQRAGPAAEPNEATAADQTCEAAPSSGHLPCAWCRGSTLHFDTVCPLGQYASELRRVVLLMKHGAQQPLAQTMARLYAEMRGPWLLRSGVDLVVPVPMHWTRRLRRGANSPEVLGHHVSSFLGVRYGRRVLRRVRRTRLQADLSPRQRFRNVRGAFRMNAGYDLEGRWVLLVDDVLTTGATCSEAAWTLKKAGAARVLVSVIARAAGPDLR